MSLTGLLAFLFLAYATFYAQAQSRPVCTDTDCWNKLHAPDAHGMRRNVPEYALERRLDAERAMRAADDPRVRKAMPCLMLGGKEACFDKK